MYQHLSLFYSERELGPAYAKVASCTALAQVLGAPLAALILGTLDGAAGLAGWKWLFLLEGAATVVFGVVLRWRLAPSPAKARMLSRAEREWLCREKEEELAAKAAATGGRHHASRWKASMSEFGGRSAGGIGVGRLGGLPPPLPHALLLPASLQRHLALPIMSPALQAWSSTGASCGSPAAGCWWPQSCLGSPSSW